jgi:imidazolonepropionase
MADAPPVTPRAGVRGVTALVGAGAVVRGPAEPGPLRRPVWDALGVTTGVGVAIADGRVALIAPDREVRAWYREQVHGRGGAHPHAYAELVECEGRIVTPGLVDPHTHAVFGAPRLDDQARRARGDDYKGIAAAGGGILQSMRDFRGRSEDELVALGAGRLAWVGALGTTTIEIKSGYGLEPEAELRALRAIGRLAARGPLAVVPTFLGAHEVPPEYRADRAAWVRLLVEELIPRVGREGLAEFCDVFCEPGVFDLEESEAILRAARGAGLGLKLHADELDPFGGAELAARLGAVSADHLGAISPGGIEALAASGTVAVLLPGTLAFLGKTKQAPARALVDAGAVVALASDFNPGSSPSANLPLMMALAVSQARLQPAEAFAAATVNAAAALGRGAGGGRLRVGGAADVAVWNCRDPRELAYWYGMPLAWRVFAGGFACHGPDAALSSPSCGLRPLSPASS